MEKIKTASHLIVQQKKEWGEILTGFETKNKYSIKNAQGEELYFAAEESSLIPRLLLKSLRPFAIHILSPNGSPVLKLNKPFRFYFHEIEVEEPSGKKLGRVKREFTILTREFSVFDALGTEIFKIYGPFFHPWTFHVKKNGTEIGKVSKKWSGIGKELFTDADNFNIEFSPSLELGHKALLLGALFLIDMLYFEQK